MFMSLAWASGRLEQTVVIENAMHVMQTTMDMESCGGVLSRKKRFRKLQTCNLIQDYSRAPVDAKPHNYHNRDKELSNDSFQADLREFSFGTAKLEGITKPSWSSPSPEQEDLSVFSQMVARRLGKEQVKEKLFE